MAASMKELGIDRFSADDRLMLLEEIWDSLTADPAQIPLSECQKRVLDRRLMDLEAKPNDVLTWDEIKTRVRGKR